MSQKQNEISEEIRNDDRAFKIAQEAIVEIEAASTPDELESTRVRFLGRKGIITSLFKEMKSFSNDEKKQIGITANKLRQLTEAAIEKKASELTEIEEIARLSSEALDITLPGRKPQIGSVHILNRVVRRITDIFLSMGYEIAEGPEIESDYYNFEALNTPDHHPAKSVSDTFYMKSIYDESGKQLLLRCHTSPVQVRVMECRKPPLYIISPGKTYRRDVPDASHLPMFSQIEGFAVDEGITFADLKGTLAYLLRELFGADRDVRFRPHFFPFTEPSAEVDVSCIMCNGSGCRICKYTGWLEILGAGMIDPNVFGYVGYDSENTRGFAFGMGVERIAMLIHGVSDIRLFYENNLEFLCQF